MTSMIFGILSYLSKFRAKRPLWRQALAHNVSIYEILPEIIVWEVKIVNNTFWISK